MKSYYDVGDLLVTQGYEDKIIEVCTHKANTGSLFLTITSCLQSQMERFVRNTDSLSYSTHIIRAENAAEFLKDYNLEKQNG